MKFLLDTAGSWLLFGAIQCEELLTVSPYSPRIFTLRLMGKILHDPKDPKLWELWYIPYYG